ncbi:MULTISPECIES: histidine kinase N-terminal 7TM domain-containing protein [unclassified Halorubrum]|uniref:histidine kinase N-terminal 7TM domain-containing protein n=1 Tax=unclassified Halorubrum TaxID=2642239 RepID=UPI0010F75789|nr:MULTISPECIES: histidine kinase N-terminal 7TM domain-containing protein [unclassified Halorubrum]TKX42265.1 PAS domain S-box protein [Halorubrum sp. ARQ200]TKX49456.1 PAS domain S-box protein [Halorubrum sp. ASP121]TKX59289.1 PAS domain S-box protein [Halorubrum sp. ASP1]
MAWQPTPYTAPLLLAAVASFGFAAYGAANRSRGGHALLWSFVAVAVAAGVWSLAYAAQLSATALGPTLFFNRFVWLGSAGLAVAWPAFVLSYVDRTAWLGRRRFALLWIVPVAVAVAVWTAGVDPLFYADPSLVDAGGYRVLSYTPTPALLGFVGYTYAVNLFTFAVLGYATVSRDGVFRRQAAVLFVAAVAPMALSAAGIAGVVGPDAGFVDFTPIAFSGTSALLAWVVFRYRLLDVSPIARDAVFANLSDGVVVCDADGRVVDTNDPAEALFPDAALGARADEAFDDVPAVADAVTDSAADDEFRVTLDGDSAPRFLTVDVHDITGPGTTRGGTVLLFRDVTERETLQRRYRALIEKSPNAIAVCGDDGLLRYVSPSIERLLGHRPTEIEGRPIIDLVHPEDRREAQQAFERAFDSAEPQSLTHRIARADGSWRRFETVIERLFADAGEVVITATDVTDARRYEQRLQVLNRVLRHDLKNDTNVIGGYADLLRDHVDEEGDPYLDIIDRKVRTLTHLSDQAREIDVALHSDAGRAEIDLSELVERLCASLSSSFPEATVTVSVPESARVSADELLESAVRNVLENAVVHNDGDDPRVEATVVADGDRFRLDVADDGPGIPPVERTVFSEARETALEHASGLGLWLVHWIVTESGGDMEIDTREPTGTVVRMWLPRAAEARE